MTVSLLPKHDGYDRLSLSATDCIQSIHETASPFAVLRSGVKTARTGIKTDGTICEYDINPLRQLNLNYYILIDQLKSRRDKKKRGSKQWRRLNAKIRNIYARINGQTKHYFHRMANQILVDHPDVIGFYVGDWDKSQTIADTGYKFIDKRINRQVQNNNPIMTLVGYLSYKASLRCKEVRKFNERGHDKDLFWLRARYSRGSIAFSKNLHLSRVWF